MTPMATSRARMSSFFMEGEPRRRQTVSKSRAPVSEDG